MKEFWNNYYKWLNADALTDAEKVELRAIEGNEDEVAFPLVLPVCAAQ